jgi:hypothetical protein
MTLLASATALVAYAQPQPVPRGPEENIYERLDVAVAQQNAPMDASEPAFEGELYAGAGDYAYADNGYWGWTILPAGIIYKSYLAGYSEPRMGVQVSHVADNDDEAGSMLDGTLGSRVGLIRYGNDDPFMPQGFQIDVEGAAKVRLNFDEEMDVQATDYRVGVPFTYGWGQKQIKFGYWHVSSHIGDEFLVRNQGFQRINYAKDSLVLGYSEYLWPDFRVYGEASWAFFSDIAEPWEFQFGFDWAPVCPTGIHGAPFIATNVHLREEVGYGGNFVAQAGWAWRSDVNGALLRMGVHYYNGKSSQYSFFDQFEEQIGFGIWYDF